MTGQEIELRRAVMAPKVAAMIRHLESMMKDLLIHGMHVALGREVCARRARKLRKRGEDVRYIGRTKTGKARYRWMNRIAPRYPLAKGGWHVS